MHSSFFNPWLIMLCFAWLAVQSSQAQQNRLILEDQRDGHRYETVKIGDVWWFKDFLKYESPSSHCPNFSEDLTDCEHGNYYSFQELDSICPVGWRIPTEIELESFVQALLEMQKRDLSDMEYDTLKVHPLSINVRDKKEEIDLMNEENPVWFQWPGWVEGHKLARSLTVSMWVKHSAILDPKFHIHLINSNYIFHTHDSYIEDDPDKSRKLRVKCVKSEKNE